MEASRTLCSSRGASVRLFELGQDPPELPHVGGARDGPRVLGRFSVDDGGGVPSAPAHGSTDPHQECCLGTSQMESCVSHYTGKMVPSTKREDVEIGCRFVLAGIPLGDESFREILDGKPGEEVERAAVPQPFLQCAWFAT